MQILIGMLRVARWVTGVRSPSAVVRGPSTARMVWTIVRACLRRSDEKATDCVCGLQRPHRVRYIEASPYSPVGQLLQHPVNYTYIHAEAEKSRYPYAAIGDTADTLIYRLSVLGVLHRWFGLTMEWED